MMDLYVLVKASQNGMTSTSNYSYRYFCSIIAMKSEIIIMKAVLYALTINND